MNIFKAYDVRGVYPTELNEEIIYKIAKAFATFTNVKKIVVGGDNRLSTPSLKESFIKGLTDSGVDVTDIGTVPTSFVYFACYKLGFEAGAMITASHNPKEFNGVKFCDSEGLAIGWEDGLNQVKEIMEKSEFKSGKGHLTQIDIFDEYFKFIQNIVSENIRGIKIVIDGSNGSAGITYTKIFRKLGVEVEELFCEPDGNFPNHSIPDPLIDENLKELKDKVRDTKADVGFALDGDGDRLVVIDDKGEKVNISHITTLLAEMCLSKYKNSKIVYDILSSQLVAEVIKQKGGIPVVWKVGHSNIPRKCKEVDACFAGEASSHFYFKESNYTDDTFIAAIKLLDIIATEKKKLSELTAKYPTYYQVLEKRIPIKDEMKFKFVEQLKEDFLKKGYEVITLDGVKIKFKDGWAIFRPSNTESKLVVSYESPNLEEFKKIESFVNEIIKTIPTSKIKVLIFDLEKVLIDTWRNVFDLPELQHIPTSRIALFFDDYNDLRKELQYGRLTEDEFWERFITITKAKVDVNTLKGCVRKVLVLNKELFELINSLKTSNYKLVLLSNFTKEWADYLNETYKLNSLFDAVFWSFDNAVKKPFPEAYKQVLEKLKVKPEECVFIDDKERNIEGAKAIGMQTILYRNLDSLKISLGKLGIIGGWYQNS